MASSALFSPAIGKVVSATYQRFEGDRAITHVPAVIHRYRVGGRDFAARRIRLLGTSTPSRAAALLRP